MSGVPEYLLGMGDARRIPLADKSVHMVACSPPYFNLRDYGDPRQIGSEPTPGEFVEAMRVVGREAWRVLRDDGSWWLNLGDSFAGSWGNQGRKEERGTQRSINGPMIQHLDSYPSKESNTGKIPEDSGLKPKDMILIPEQVALALRKDGWYLRAKPPWIKPSPMPESTNDRPNVAHESIFLLTKSPTYFFDMEAVRRPSAAATLSRDAYTRITSGKDGAYAVQHDHETPSDPGGRHLRTNDFFTESLDSLIEYHENYAAHLRKIRDDGGLLLSEGGDPLAFWLATQSFNGAHFATWPEQLVRLMVLASTSQTGCCPACAAPWARIVKRVTTDSLQKTWVGADQQLSKGLSRPGQFVGNSTRTIDWQPSCPCDAGAPIPCVVLDNFSGVATTAKVAISLGRRAIGIDLNRDYLVMGATRIADGLRPVSKYDPPKPLKPLDGQGDLFAALEADTCPT